MKSIMRGLLFFVYALSAFSLAAQTNKSKLAFPGLHWQQVAKPEDLGFSSSKLLLAQKYADSIHSTSVMVVVNGKLLRQWGAVEAKIDGQSLRKSYLNAIYGKYVKNGTINLDTTLAQIGIDDMAPSLSDIEKMATIRDCMKSRSGIYHDAVNINAKMKQLRPARYSQMAGTHWYYNNWDFNVLGTIFQKLTARNLFEVFQSEIAKPIGMEDLTLADCKFTYDSTQSIHPAYNFMVSARDLARFGLLMLNKGNWNGQQIIDASWVEESTRYHSDATLFARDGYGYLWWSARDFNKYGHIPNVTLPEGTFSGWGAGGHFLLIIPKYNMIIVHRVDALDPSLANNMKNPWNSISNEEFGILVKKILEARL